MAMPYHTHTHTLDTLCMFFAVQSNNGTSSSGVSSSNSGASMNGSSEYWKQLQSLNIGVSKWISSHVEKNPHVDLTPIFRDYEKHLKTIDMKVCTCMLGQSLLLHVCRGTSLITYLQGNPFNYNALGEYSLLKVSSIMSLLCLHILYMPHT